MPHKPPLMMKKHGVIGGRGPTSVVSREGGGSGSGPLVIVTEHGAPPLRP